MPKFDAQHMRYVRLVDQYSRHIKSPVQRLKFLNRALKSIPEPGGFLTRIPMAGLLRERTQLIFEVSKVLAPTQRAPWSFRATAILYRLRFFFYVACCAVVLVVSAGAGYVGSKVVSRFAVSSEANSAGDPQVPSSVGAAAIAGIGSEAGERIGGVWLADSGEGYDFYSNGARVLTEFATTGPERRFHRFNVDGLASGSDDFEVVDKPVGILYHLSEGDLLPFADTYNSSLMYHSKTLLEYCREHGLYNYVIDRFGRTYRIVQDQYAANHAGKSAWGNERNLYVNLSASFIGVCFEGKSGASARPDGINEAQIYAARVLTAVLRSKYGIEDANCVTHGLVSVNPSNKLMGYHTDWVAGFPFQALGLTDKYESEVAAISRFGFGYDQQYIKAAGGKPWPGLHRSEDIFRDEATRAGISEDEERKVLWAAFQRAYAKEGPPY